MRLSFYFSAFLLRSPLPTQQTASLMLSASRKARVCLNMAGKTTKKEQGEEVNVRGRVRERGDDKGVAVLVGGGEICWPVWAHLL